MRFWTLLTAFLIDSLGQSAIIENQFVLDSGLEANMTMDAMMLGKTYDNARLTYYDITVGTTACGSDTRALTIHGLTDFLKVVALNGAQFGSGYPGPNCFKNIHITANGKSATAQIVDECPGCPYGGLDLTEGLFKHFAPLDKGVLKGSWYFV